MAKSDITGKRRLLARNVSHSNIKTKRWQNINLQTRRVWVPELGRFVTLHLTTRDIRTIDKIGVVAYAKRHGAALLTAAAFLARGSALGEPRSDRPAKTVGSA